MSPTILLMLAIVAALLTLAYVLVVRAYVAAKRASARTTVLSEMVRHDARANMLGRASTGLLVVACFAVISLVSILFGLALGSVGA